MENWKRENGSEAVDQGTVIEDGWRVGEDDGSREAGLAPKTFSPDYKIPCDNHGLAYLLKPRADGSLPPASSPHPPRVIPEPLTLQQELERDPDAQMFVASTLGCLVRRCLFRDGKGGVHMSNYGQARLEGNVFRCLNYAVRCIQNSIVNMAVIQRNH